MLESGPGVTVPTTSQNGSVTVIIALFVRPIGNDTGGTTDLAIVMVVSATLRSFRLSQDSWAAVGVTIAPPKQMIISKPVLAGNKSIAHRMFYSPMKALELISLDVRLIL